MIPLQDYIDALLQCQEYYVQLSVRQTAVMHRAIIDECKSFVMFYDPNLPKSTVIEFKDIVLEAEPDTIFPNTGKILPPLTDGSKRLWHRISWEEYNSPLKKKERKIKQMLQEHLKA